MKEKKNPVLKLFIALLFTFVMMLPITSYAATYYVNSGGGATMWWSCTRYNSRANSPKLKYSYPHTGSECSWTSSYSTVTWNQSSSSRYRPSTCNSISFIRDSVEGSRSAGYKRLNAHTSVDGVWSNTHIYMYEYSSDSASFSDSTMDVNICSHPSWSGWCGDTWGTHYRYCNYCGAWMTSHGCSQSGWNASGSTHYTYCTGGCGWWLQSHGAANSGWCTNGSTHYTYCTTCNMWTSSHGISESGWQTSGSTHYKYCTSCSMWTTSHTISESGWQTSGSTHYKNCNTCSTWTTSHTISPSDWKPDASGHYKICTGADGLTVEGPAGHSYSYAWKSGSTHTKTCTVCGYSADEACSITSGQCTNCKHWFTINIAFDDNGGSGGPGDKTLQIGSSYIPTPNPSRTGYRFNGWNTTR